jgi:hypothetical protein
MTTPHFPQPFGPYVCHGDRICTTVGRCDVVAHVEQDGHITTPWDEYDGLGTVTEWVRRDKRPGEKILTTDRQYRRYYDYAGAVANARREWPTSAEAVAAVDREYDVWRAWCAQEWYYGVVVVTVSADGVTLATEALGGVEVNYPGTDNSYLTEVAAELLAEALPVARTRASELARTLATLTPED